MGDEEGRVRGTKRVDFTPPTGGVMNGGSPFGGARGGDVAAASPLTAMQQHAQQREAQQAEQLHDLKQKVLRQEQQAAQLQQQQQQQQQPLIGRMRSIPEPLNPGDIPSDMLPNGGGAAAHPRQPPPSKPAPDSKADGHRREVYSIHGEQAARRRAIAELIFFAGVNDLRRCRQMAATWNIDVTDKGCMDYDKRTPLSVFGVREGWGMARLVVIGCLLAHSGSSSSSGSTHPL